MLAFSVSRALPRVFASDSRRRRAVWQSKDTLYDAYFLRCEHTAAVASVSNHTAGSTHLSGGPERPLVVFSKGSVSVSWSKVFNPQPLAFRTAPTTTLLTPVSCCIFSHLVPSCHIPPTPITQGYAKAKREGAARLLRLPGIALLNSPSTSQETGLSPSIPKSLPRPRRRSLTASLIEDETVKRGCAVAGVVSTSSASAADSRQDTERGFGEEKAAAVSSSSGVMGGSSGGSGGSSNSRSRRPSTAALLFKGASSIMGRASSSARLASEFLAGTDSTSNAAAEPIGNNQRRTSPPSSRHDSGFLSTPPLKGTSAFRSGPGLPTATKGGSMTAVVGAGGGEASLPRSRPHVGSSIKGTWVKGAHAKNILGKGASKTMSASKKEASSNAAIPDKEPPPPPPPAKGSSAKGATFSPLGSWARWASAARGGVSPRDPSTSFFGRRPSATDLAASNREVDSAPAGCDATDGTKTPPLLSRQRSFSYAKGSTPSPKRRASPFPKMAKADNKAASSYSSARLDSSHSNNSPCRFRSLAAKLASKRGAAAGPPSTCEGLKAKGRGVGESTAEEEGAPLEERVYRPSGGRLLSSEMAGSGEDGGGLMKSGVSGSEMGSERVKGERGHVSTVKDGREGFAENTHDAIRSRGLSVPAACDIAATAATAAAAASSGRNGAHHRRPSSTRRRSNSTGVRGTDPVAGRDSVARREPAAGSKRNRGSAANKVAGAGTSAGPASADPSRSRSNGGRAHSRSVSRRHSSRVLRSPPSKHPENGVVRRATISVPQISPRAARRVHRASRTEPLLTHSRFGSKARVGGMSEREGGNLSAEAAAAAAANADQEKMARRLQRFRVMADFAATTVRMLPSSVILLLLFIYSGLCVASCSTCIGKIKNVMYVTP